MTSGFTHGRKPQWCAGLQTHPLSATHGTRLLISGDLISSPKKEIKFIFSSTLLSTSPASSFSLISLLL